MSENTLPTFWIRLYLSGPIEIAKQIIREDVIAEGLCVTVAPTLFIYTGGEESGYVVGLINYPRFPTEPEAIIARARRLAEKLLTGTHQHSALIQTPNETTWISKRDSGAVP